MRQRAGSADFARDELLRRRLSEARAFGDASAYLSSHHPHLSARRGMNMQQRLAGMLLAAGVGAWIFYTGMAAINAIAMLVAAVFAMIIIARICSVIMAIKRPRIAGTRRLTAQELPKISVLVPLYKEAEVVANLITAIGRLDYPVWRLEVKLLVEADDHETLKAIQAVALPSHFELIPVPPGEPRTKPKALNYAMEFITGDLVVVFDAEDLPSPEQPRAAVDAFREGGSIMAVVQAPLLIHNGGDGWISAQFALEYAIHFQVWLPLLARSGWPVPLGGTSNYFRRDVLLKVGGWDAWNVTEDADIGLRFARFGYTTGMVTPPTYEEAPVKLGPWLRQRSRWIKGHLQTLIVLNRHPLRVMGEMGVWNYLSIYLTLGGGLLASLLHGPLYAWIAANALLVGHLEPWHWILFAAGYASAIGAALVSGSPHARPWMLLTLLVYWPLQSAAMICALWEMLARPHFWAKTQHGLTHSLPVIPTNAPDAPLAVEAETQLHFDFIRAG